MLSFFFFFVLMIRLPPRSTLFPSRRSSDLYDYTKLQHDAPFLTEAHYNLIRSSLTVMSEQGGPGARHQDRKSTRLNSSHANISYAVFCLKKKQLARRPASCITPSPQLRLPR